jgi:hypothetical protein
MGKLKKVLSTLIILIVAVIASVIARYGMHALLGPKEMTDADWDTALTKAENDIRPKLPMKVDDVTTLVRVHHSRKVFMYDYKVGVTAAQMPSNGIELVRGTTKTSVCAKKEMVASMRAGGAYQYIYFDKDEKYLGSFQLMKDDCK